MAVHLNILHKAGYTDVTAMSYNAEYTGIHSHLHLSSPLHLYTSSPEPTKSVAEIVRCFLLCCTTQTAHFSFHKQAKKKVLAFAVRTNKYP